jgi:hypothetical protein
MTCNLLELLTARNRSQADEFHIEDESGFGRDERTGSSGSYKIKSQYQVRVEIDKDRGYHMPNVGGL